MQWGRGGVESGSSVGVGGLPTLVGGGYLSPPTKECHV